MLWKGSASCLMQELYQNLQYSATLRNSSFEVHIFKQNYLHWLRTIAWYILNTYITFVIYSQYTKVRKCQRLSITLLHQYWIAFDRMFAVKLKFILIWIEEKKLFAFKRIGGNKLWKFINLSNSYKFLLSNLHFKSDDALKKLFSYRLILL